MRIELAAKANQVNSMGIPPIVMRQNILNFMSYLRVYVYRYKNHQWKKLHQYLPFYAIKVSV